MFLRQINILYFPRAVRVTRFGVPKGPVTVVQEQNILTKLGMTLYMVSHD